MSSSARYPTTMTSTALTARPYQRAARQSPAGTEAQFVIFQVGTGIRVQPRGACEPPRQNLHGDHQGKRRGSLTDRLRLDAQTSLRHLTILRSKGQGSESHIPEHAGRMGSELRHLLVGDEIDDQFVSIRRPELRMCKFLDIG